MKQPKCSLIYNADAVYACMQENIIQTYKEEKFAIFDSMDET